MMFNKALVLCSLLLIQVAVGSAYVHGHRSLKQIRMSTAGKMTILDNPTSVAAFNASVTITSPISFSTIRVPKLVDGWCIDQINFIDEKTTYCTEFFLSTDSNLATTISRIKGIKLNNYNFNSFNRVNWVLNRYVAGSADGESECYSATGKVFTVEDIQEAIWELMMSSAAPYTAKTCRGKYIAAQARKRGGGFLPVACWEKVAIIAVVYDCNRLRTFTDVQILALSVNLQQVGLCARLPQCTIPKLPVECIGVPRAKIAEVLGKKPVSKKVEYEGRRNLDCGECVQFLDARYPDKAPHPKPEGCGCPDYPCCSGPNFDAPGEGCPPCPAIALGFSSSQAISGPGSCAAAQSWIETKTVSAFEIRQTAFEELVPAIKEFNNEPFEGNITIVSTSAKISNIIATACAKAMIRWFQWACVCSRGPGGRAESVVGGRAQATAWALAKAFSAASAAVNDTRFPGFLASADTQADALASSLEIAINKLVPQVKTASQGTCVGTTVNGVPAILETVKEKIATSIACAVTRVLASVFYINEPVNNPTGTPDAQACSCSYAFSGVPAKVRGKIDKETVCPSNCPMQGVGCPCPDGRLFSVSKLTCKSNI